MTFQAVASKFLIHSQSFKVRTLYVDQNILCGWMFSFSSSMRVEVNFFGCFFPFNFTSYCEVWINNEWPSRAGPGLEPGHEQNRLENFVLFCFVVHFELVKKDIPSMVKVMNPSMFKHVWMTLPTEYQSYSVAQFETRKDICRCDLNDESNKIMVTGQLHFVSSQPWPLFCNLHEIYSSSVWCTMFYFIQVEKGYSYFYSYQCSLFGDLTIFLSKCTQFVRCI